MLLEPETGALVKFPNLVILKNPPKSPRYSPQKNFLIRK